MREKLEFGRDNRLNKFLSIFSTIAILSAPVTATSILIDTQAEFDEGNYFQTDYNTTNNTVRLNDSFSSGSYTSSILDAGVMVRWSQVNLITNGAGQELPNEKEIESIPGGANMTGNVLLYHMNDLSGSISDYSGEMNDGSATNVVFGVEGKFGKAINFSNSYIINNAPSNLPSGDVPKTIEGWFKSTNLTDDPVLFGFGDNAIGENFQIATYSNNWSVVGLTIGYDWVSNASAIPYFDGEWHHIVVTYNGTTTKIFADGLEVDSTNSYTFATNPQKVVMGIEIDIYDRYYFGDLDEVAFYNRALSSAEIMEHYKRGVTNLKLLVRSCNDSQCLGESFVGPNLSNETNYTKINNTLQNTMPNRYFQYKFYFETVNPTFTPELYNLTIFYDSQQKTTSNPVFEENGNQYFYSGSFYNTELNSDGESIKLFYNSSTGIQSSGNFTSAIFDAESDVKWSQVNLITNGAGQELPNEKEIESIPGGANMSENILLYHMNDPSGELRDYSGECYGGVPHGDPEYSVVGKFGYGIRFDGVDSYISTSLDINQSASTPGCTMEAWVYPENTSPSTQYIISSDNGGYDWSVLRGDTDTWVVFTGEMGRDTGLSVDENEWQHVAAVFIPGTGVRFYKNGNEVLIPYISYDTSDNNVAIGRNPGYSGYFNGTIDEVAVFNRTLTKEEIVNHYKRGILKINLMARSCNDSECSGEEFVGTDGTVNSNYSKMNSTLYNLPKNRYFQYKLNFETEDVRYSPEVFKTTVYFSENGSYSVSSPVVDENETKYYFYGTFDNVEILNNEMIALYYNKSMGRYPILGNFTSAIFDAGEGVNWAHLDLNCDICYQCELPDNKETENWPDAANMSENILLYHLDETSGEVKDTSGEENDGIVHSATYMAEGKFNYALDFDGSDDYISTHLDIDQSASTPGITMEAWVYPESSTGIRNIINTDNSGYDWTLRIQDGYYVIFTGSGSWNTYVVPDLNEWQHVAAVFIPGTGVKFYKNGLFVSTSSIGYDTDDGYLTIGKSATWDDHFDGKIDEVAIYNRPLDHEEILNHYKRGILKINLTVRSCNDSQCFGESFLGPYGPSSTINYTKRENTLQFLANNRYFQYRVFLETENCVYSPKLLNTSIWFSEKVAPVSNTTVDDNGTQSFFSGDYCFTELEAGTGKESISLYNGGGLQYISSGNFTSAIFDGNSSIYCNEIKFITNNAGIDLPDNKLTESTPNGANMTGNVLLYHLDETNGTSIKDYSGENNEGAFNGSINSTEGKFNNSIIFDGSTNHINCSNGASLKGMSELTLEAWVYPEEYTNLTIIGGFNYPRENESKYSLEYIGDSFGGDNYFLFKINTSQIYTLRSSTFTSYQTNNWYHVVATYDGSDTKLYVNGRLDTSGSATGEINSQTTLPTLIGGSPSDINGVSMLFNGTIDEVAIYNRAISETEVTGHYIRGVTNLNFSVRMCDDANCTGVDFIDIPDILNQGLNLAANRYFQYKVEFETEDTSYTPVLYNTTLHFSVFQKIIDVSVSGVPIDFGNANPGTNDSLPLSGGWPVNVTVHSTTNVTWNLSVKASGDFTREGHQIPVSHLEFGNSSTNVAYPMSIEYQGPELFQNWNNQEARIESNRHIYFDLDIPEGSAAGEYSTTVYINVEEA